QGGRRQARREAGGEEVLGLQAREVVLILLLGARLMDLTLTPAEREFRDELRGWIADNHPGRTPEGDEAAFDFTRAWQQKLNERGWAGLTWPKEYGGAG